MNSTSAATAASRSGIKQLDRYGSERWRVESEYCVKLDSGLRSVGMLMEPTAVVAKAIEQIERIGQHGLEVHVLDQVSAGPKPQLVEDLGATYHSGDIADVVGKTGADAILEAGGTLSVEAGSINRDLVLQSNVVLGSVNANHRHYEAAAKALADADRAWLERLITRRVPLEHYGQALESEADDVKVVIELGPSQV